MQTDTNTTYRNADGTLIYGEYTTVTDLDYFQDAEPGDQIIEERWVLLSRRIGTVHGQSCEHCAGEGELDDGATCTACNGYGEYTGERITWSEDVGDEPAG